MRPSRTIDISTGLFVLLGFAAILFLVTQITNREFTLTSTAYRLRAEFENIGGLKQAGVDSEAEAFLANELNNPPSVQDLARSITSPQEAVQVYTAARIAVTVDSPAEKQFLTSLAQALNIDPKLAAHIDATAASAAA